MATLVGWLAVGGDGAAAVEHGLAVAVLAVSGSRQRREDALDDAARRQASMLGFADIAPPRLKSLTALRQLPVARSLLSDASGAPRPGAMAFVDELRGLGVTPAVLLPSGASAAALPAGFTGLAIRSEWPEAPEVCLTEPLPGTVILQVGPTSLPVTAPGFDDTLRLLDLARATAWRREQSTIWTMLLQTSGILLAMAGAIGFVGAVLFVLGTRLFNRVNTRLLLQWQPMHKPKMAAVVVRARCGGG